MKNLFYIGAILNMSISVLAQDKIEIDKYTNVGTSDTLWVNISEWHCFGGETIQYLIYRKDHEFEAIIIDNFKPLLLIDKNVLKPKEAFEMWFKKNIDIVKSHATTSFLTKEELNQLLVYLNNKIETLKPLNSIRSGDGSRVHIKLNENEITIEFTCRIDYKQPF